MLLGAHHQNSLRLTKPLKYLPFAHQTQLVQLSQVEHNQVDPALLLCSAQISTHQYLDRLQKLSDPLLSHVVVEYLFDEKNDPAITTPTHQANYLQTRHVNQSAVVLEQVVMMYLISWQKAKDCQISQHNPHDKKNKPAHYFAPMFPLTLFAHCLIFD